VNKRRIKSASKLLKSVFDDSVKAEDLLYGILDADLRDCRNALERSQLKESLEE
jgi:hypothetical protein